MSMMTNFCRLFTTKRSVNKSSVVFNSLNSQIRSYADTPKPDIHSKHVAVQGATENEERMRVRRARPADVPRVLRFVREHAKTAWPGLIVPPSVSHIVLCDYVARALAQGHSMLAEQPEHRQGLSNIRGLALSTSVCPWDATILEKWARCVKCPRSRRLMHFTAHCLRAPALHDKYHVHNILQVVLVVPPNTAKSTEIVQILAKNAIQRGRDVGFSVLRFDVTDETMAHSLEELQLKKEWQLSFDVYPAALKELEAGNLIQKPARILKVEPVLKEKVSKADASKDDASKVDASKVDASTVDASQVDASKVDASKVDASKVDASKVDASKVDASKVDAAKIDASNADASKTDASKLNASKSDASNTETAAKNTKQQPYINQPKPIEGNFITVYTAFPKAQKN